MREIVKRVFAEHYSDLHIYRWLNRNKSWLKIFYAFAFPLTTLWAIMGSSWPLFGVGGSFIALIWAGAVDHFYIGLKLRKIRRTLEGQGISITQPMILEICKDIIPS